MVPIGRYARICTKSNGYAPDRRTEDNNTDSHGCAMITRKNARLNPPQFGRFLANGANFLAGRKNFRGRVATKRVENCYDLHTKL